MIDQTLNTIVRMLNERFENTFSVDEDFVILSALIDIEGKVVVEQKDVIVLTLVNIEQEKHFSTGSPLLKNEVLNLNLYILFSAHFQAKNYEQGLLMISKIIAFFHEYRVFDAHNAPDLPATIERLSFEIYNLQLLQVSNIWSAFGGKLLPNVCYKLRSIGIPKHFLPFDEKEIKTINL